MTAVVVVGLAVTAWWSRPWESFQHRSERTSDEPVTGQVERATLTSQVRLNGDLTYGGTVALPASVGTITALPGPGTTIKKGKEVYEADGRPIVLFQGPRPFWRALSVGSDPGQDIRQLEENLAALGFFSGKPDEIFDWRTRQAVRDWQHSLGVPETGAFSPGDVVVARAPGIRIAQITAALGQQAASPATYTETTLRVVAKLTAAQARELRVGTPVTVILPDGTEAKTTLSALDPGGRPISGSDQTTSPTATIEFPNQSKVAKAGPTSVRVVVGDKSNESETLVVPVTALVATPDGGYAVEISANGRTVRTPVEVGLVADARAQILNSGSNIEGKSGPVLKAGDLVVLAQ